jgi:hypothetical protein
MVVTARAAAGDTAAASSVALVMPAGRVAAGAAVVPAWRGAPVMVALSAVALARVRALVGRRARRGRARPRVARQAVNASTPPSAAPVSAVRKRTAAGRPSSARCRVGPTTTVGRASMNPTTCVCPPRRPSVQRTRSKARVTAASSRAVRQKWYFVAARTNASVRPAAACLPVEVRTLRASMSASKSAADRPASSA